MLWNRSSVNKSYKLNKSREILKEAYGWFKKNKSSQTGNAEFDIFESNLRQLDQSVLKKDALGADVYARKVEAYLTPRNKKGLFHYAFELITALIVALVVATIVRQMWFEIYEIPTGSMRPTFKEKDHVTVSKTAFGINVPLKTDHFIFDPSLVKRTGVIIFSSDNLPLSDTDSTYFGILPYKKRFVKRLIGKPGDTLYFYGGKVYGIDREGLEIKDLIDSPHLEKIDFIPFMYFEGAQYSPRYNETLLFQFRQPIGLILKEGGKETRGLIHRNGSWVLDNSLANKNPHKTIETYSDFWGMKNYAMARLLTKEQVEKFTDYSIDDDKDIIMYLELKHTPSLTFPKPVNQPDGWHREWRVPGYTTVIPLKKNHLETLMESLYTARFIVENGRARRYEVDNQQFKTSNPLFPNLPNGTYEFYYGKAYSIGFGGHARLLEKTHPIYQKDPETVQKLFNLGIDFDTNVEPSKQNSTFYPRRYAYYREGDLYLMGAPLFKKDDPLLTSFQEKEREREKIATSSKPYVAFKDYGAPYKNGMIDVNYVKSFGLKIPDKHYLVLGDNHAMSGDSRIFGFLPEDNIQGAPSLIIWPFGERWGFPNMLSYPLITVPRAIIWSLAGFALLAFLYYQYRRNQRSYFS